MKDKKILKKVKKLYKKYNKKKSCEGLGGRIKDARRQIAWNSIANPWLRDAKF